MFLSGLCFITDRKACNLSTEDMVFKILGAGIRWVQYREKEKSRKDIYQESLIVREMTRQYNAVFIVNDHADIAFAVGAEGVHLGQDDLPIREARKILGKNKIIGLSTHDIEQALNAKKEGADYIGFGPIFHTKTKEAGEPRGLDMLRNVKKLVDIPVVAIGGINHENVRSVLETGVDAIAVASAILIGDIEDNVKKFLDIIYSYKSAV